MKYDERAMASCPPAFQIPNYGDWRTPEPDPSNDIAALDKEIATMEARRKAAKDMQQQKRPGDDVIVFDDNNVQVTHFPRNVAVSQATVKPGPITRSIYGIGY